MLHVVEYSQVRECVVWQLLHNTFFCLDSILLTQGPRMIHIGGFLNAQIMVLWAIFKESMLFTHEGLSTHMKEVKLECSSKGFHIDGVTAGPQLIFPMDVSLPKNKGLFNTYGMRGGLTNTMNWLKGWS